MSFSFQVSFSLPYHGAIFAFPAAVTTRPKNTSLKREKKPSTTHPTFPRTKREKKGKNIRSLGSRLLCRPKMRSPAILLLLLLAAAADAIGEFRIKMFFARNKITVFKFSNLSRRTHSITHTTFAVDIPLGFYSEFSKFYKNSAVWLRHHCTPESKKKSRCRTV